MLYRLLLRLLLALPVITCGSVTMADDHAIGIEDLQYGNLVFQSYSSADANVIARLMATQERGELKHHAEDVQMLRGRLELAYDLPDDAEKQFRRTLNSTAEKNIRNRAWYSLGRIAFQRGDYEQARKLLQNFVSTSDRELTAEHAFLQALAEMKLGQYQEAAGRLQDINAPDDMDTYLRLNRGVALLQLGWVEAGREALEVIGLMQTDNPELRALRDRANLNLGYEMLRARRPNTALTFLNRVRLHGPYAEPALLGAGWANIHADNYANALVPWLELSKRQQNDAAVQEVFLAVPFAYEKLNDDARAIQSYKIAIALYDQELNRLTTVARSARTGLLDGVIDQLATGLTDNRVDNELQLSSIPGAPYFVKLVAGAEFQRQLQHYRELMLVDRQFKQWSNAIDQLRNRLSTRYQDNKRQSSATTLVSRFAALRDKLNAQLADNDPLRLASTHERRQWQKLQTIQARLSTHTDNPEFLTLLEKTRWLKGLLYWQIQEEYPQRRRNLQVLLQQLQGPASEVLHRRKVIEQVLDITRTGFLSPEDRLDALQIRLDLLRPEIAPTQQRIADALTTMAVQTITRRRERVAAYRAQAQYALARIYDELTQQQSANRDEAGQ